MDDSTKIYKLLGLMVKCTKAQYLANLVATRN